MILYVLADLFWSVWFVLVLPARVCASLTSFALVWFGLPGITWSGLSSSGLFCFALVWSSALVRIGLFLAILPQAAFLSLAWFLPIESCFVLVWSTLLYSRLVCSGIFGLVFFTSGCLVCCAPAGLVGQRS